MSDNNYIEFNEATLIAYVNGELSEEQRGLVDHWLTLSDDNKTELERIRKIWLSAKGVQPQPVSVDTEKALARVLSQINLDTEVHQISPKTHYKKIIFSAAAVIVILFAAVSIINFLSNDSVNQLEITAKNEILEDTLSDGSIVSLNNNSMLSYPSKFSNNERRVKLSGEAFFDIERNESKPFIIDLHQDFYVKVLGTSFNINANENDSLTEVFVKSGKVEFGSQNDKVILLAGEKGIMNNRTGRVEKVIDETEDLKSLYWRSEELNFDHMNLSTSLDVLEDVFEVEIILKCDSKTNAQVVSKHEHESLDEILKVISSMHDLTITKNSLNYTLSCD